MNIHVHSLFNIHSNVVSSKVCSKLIPLCLRFLYLYFRSLWGFDHQNGVFKQNKYIQLWHTACRPRRFTHVNHCMDHVDQIGPNEKIFYAKLCRSEFFKSHICPSPNCINSNWNLHFLALHTLISICNHVWSNYSHFILFLFLSLIIDFYIDNSTKIRKTKFAHFPSISNNIFCGDILNSFIFFQLKYICSTQIFHSKFSLK